MADYVLCVPAEPIKPDYCIWHFTGGIYKIVKFKRRQRCVLPPIRGELKNDTKFSQSVSRARKVILEYALCNDWKYFVTFTLDKSKYDRHDFGKFREDLTAYMRDLRKKYKKAGYPCKLDYLFVPEQHKDGAWHMHGLLSDISPFVIPFHCQAAQGMNVPDKLVAGHYFNWPDYQRKFGFCSLGIIRDRIACGFYVTKYLSKYIDLCPVSVGKHLHFNSNKLNRASLHGDCYGYCSELEPYLTHDYEFCKTGFTNTKDNAPWHFGMQYMDYSMLEQFKYDTPDISYPEIDYMQMVFDDLT